jgi:hypothetical protein
MIFKWRDHLVAKEVDPALHVEMLMMATPWIDRRVVQ